MQIIFLGRKELRCFIGIFIFLLLLVGFMVNWSHICRSVLGVKPGVKLEGRRIQGMLPGEVAIMIRHLAAQINREPHNAYYYQETGQIIPAQPGKNVDIALNVSRVFAAKPGTNVRIAVNRLLPVISEDFFQVVYHGQKDRPRVALAINVAWGEEFLVEMLKILKTEKVKATFFFVGTWVKAFPELVREIAAMGHEVANHGSFHGHPEQMNSPELKKLILDNTELLTAVTGKKPVNYFAPPYGELNASIVNSAAELGYRTIMWSVDSVDWKNPAPEILLNRVLSKIEPGGIILLHPTAPTKACLRELIQSLRKRGLEPGTVSSVL